MARIVEDNGGTVVKTIGDELMVRFESADDAVCAARTIHQRLHLGHFEATGKLMVKIGIHYGPAILEQGDIFGDAVNTAARMVAIALPEQISWSPRKPWQRSHPSIAVERSLSIT